MVFLNITKLKKRPVKRKINKAESDKDNCQEARFSCIYSRARNQSQIGAFERMIPKEKFNNSEDCAIFIFLGGALNSR
jgi:hypothetical protein